MALYFFVPTVEEILCLIGQPFLQRNNKTSALPSLIIGSSGKSVKKDNNINTAILSGILSWTADLPQ
jgi:hypothetical protein